MVQVTTGVQDDEYIQITENLSPGVEIVSGPYSAVSKSIKEGSELYKKDEKSGKNKESEGQ